MGWLAPLLIRTKLFFQKLWIKNYDWDQPLKESDQKTWIELSQAATGFHKVISRKATENTAKHRLVTCADASTTTMAACTYIAHEGEQTLIMARTKLPSIKEKHTIPKMEMNAVTIAARLSLTIYEELRKAININEIVILTDSEIGLNWIKSPKEKKFRGLLVTNRINETMKIVEKLRDEGVDIQFGYIATQHNPADCATRGLTAEELKNHNWWDGPDFSRKHRREWPSETQLFTP
ncbi:hypothetical protein ANCDUO_27092, partial [Ancylostoma duodenale]